MHQSNSKLVHAFPAALRNDVLASVSLLPKSRYSSDSFSVRIADEIVVLPYRIYSKPMLIRTIFLPTLQRRLLDCLLTRHNDGFVRQKSLQRIIAANHVWIPPFVVQLAAEYVIEILHVIHQNLETMDRTIYREFLKANPEFFVLTKQRVMSYWNCYYRGSYRRGDYVGFHVMDYFDAILRY